MRKSGIGDSGNVRAECGMESASGWGLFARRLLEWRLAIGYDIENVEGDVRWGEDCSGSEQYGPSSAWH